MYVRWEEIDEDVEDLYAGGHYAEFNELPEGALDRSYNEGDESADLFYGFWYPGRQEDLPEDPERYKGTRLYWHTLEEYRELNPRSAR